MKLAIFVVRDSASDQYGTPMFVPSAGVAMRSFTSEVNRPAEDNLLYKYPSEFELFELGTFDISTGLFESHAPRSVATAQSVAIREPSSPR